MTVINQARPIKRKRRTKAQIEQLRSQIEAVLEHDSPQSVRHVFYRMTNPRLPEPVEKTDQGYNQVQNQITQMRRKGILPYGSIADATRTGHHVHTFGGREEFLRKVTHLYRANLWEDAGVYIEVWCESRSIAGVIQADCRELAVSLYPCGGFASITFAYEGAQTINACTLNGDIPAEIIFVGDYDPAGVLIDQSLETEIRKHIDPDVELNFFRLAITPEQITAYDLPAKPRKLTDRRALHVHETVEAEAMPAEILRQLLRDRIESYLPSDALRISKIAEESERHSLLELADQLEVQP